LVANFSTTNPTIPIRPGRNLKTTGRWHKKSGRDKAVISSKYRTPACKNSINIYAPVEQQVEKLTEANMPMPLKKTTNAIRKNPQLATTRQEINEHIFGTIKRQWGYNHTNLTGQ
jgi:hypothetical protein